MRQIVEFKETQRFAPWVGILAGSFSLLALIGVVVQVGLGHPIGDKPMPNAMLIVFALLFGLGLPALLMSFRLDVETSFEGVWIRFFPLVNRLVTYDEIASAETQTYNPLLEYGGWGIRGIGKRVAYNARGNRGVFLTLKDGATIMIGSQRETELEAAIRSGMTR
jgi:hypothetical protein